MKLENQESVMLAVAAALLDQGRNIDRLSRLVTILALSALTAIAMLDVEPPVLVACLTLAVLAGLGCLYLGGRVAFDACLFRQLASTEDLSRNLARLDETLFELGLLNAGKNGRPGRARISGAFRLLRRQLGIAIMQIALILAGSIHAFLG